MRIIQRSAIFALLFTACSVAAQKNQKPEALRLVLPNVQFAKEKSAIRGDAAGELDEVAALMKKSPGVTVEIGAHSDASGSASYNLRLSQQRASAVSAYLVKKGIAAKRLKARGFGETQPLNRCRRGVRCSAEEKRANRRIELRVQGLPADEDIQNQWLILGGQPITLTQPPIAARKPDIPKPSFANLSADTNKAKPVEDDKPATPEGVDFFPELSDGKQYVPQPLPGTFIGYTVEIICADKPLAAGHAKLRQFDAIFLRQEAGGKYCYFTGAFHTLTEAQQFLRKEALPSFPQARVISFFDNEKKYYNH